MHLLTTLTMNRPALQLMIGDEQLRAIGHVAAQWAYFETQLDVVLHVLLAQPSAKELGLRIDQSFQKRMTTLKQAAQIVLSGTPQELRRLLGIVAEASSLRGKRDEIVHGHWKLHRQRGKGPLTTGIRFINMRGPRIRVRELPLTAAKAEAVANKISVAHLQLIDWSARNIP